MWFKSSFKNLKIKFINIPSLEKLYWLALAVGILVMTSLLNSFWLGLLLSLFIFFSVLVFDERKELTFALISLFFAFWTFDTQKENFILEHRPYLGISNKINYVFETDTKKIIFEFIIQNNSNYLAENVRTKTRWLIANKNTEFFSDDNLGVIFPHGEAKKDSFFIPNKPELFKMILDGKTSVKLEVVVTYDSYVVKNRQTSVMIKYSNGEMHMLNASAR